MQSFRSQSALYSESNAFKSYSIQNLGLLLVVPTGIRNIDMCDTLTQIDHLRAKWTQKHLI